MPGRYFSSLLGLMVVLAYNAKGLSFLLFFSAVYTLIFAVVPIVASFKSARIVIDDY